MVILVGARLLCLGDYYNTEPNCRIRASNGRVERELHKRSERSFVRVNQVPQPGATGRDVYHRAIANPSGLPC